MSSGELDNLVERGLLKREPGDQNEFDGLVASGGKRLADAKKGGLSAESTFDLAYNAAHSFALAAMRWHGYRPANKRYIVFQALQHTLAIKPEVWRVLDKCHGLRNSLEYDGAFTRLLTELVAAAELLEMKIKALGPVAAGKS
jgi:hypothetical protein